MLSNILMALTLIAVLFSVLAPIFLPRLRGSSRMVVFSGVAVLISLVNLGVYLSLEAADETPTTQLEQSE